MSETDWEIERAMGFGMVESVQGRVEYWGERLEWKWRVGLGAKGKGC